MFDTEKLEEEEDFEPTPNPNIPPADTPVLVNSPPSTHPNLPLSRMQKLKAALCIRERAKKSDPTRGSRPLSKKLNKCFPKNGPTIKAAVALEDVKAAHTGFVGVNNFPQTDRTYTLQEATGPGSDLGFTLEKWDGRSPFLVIDKNMTICAILAGHPNVNDWPTVHQEAACAIKKGFQHCSFPPERLNHRQGAFPALQCGVSHGGGQPHPMNLKNEPGNKKVLDKLNKMECFNRIASFGSAVMMNRAPALYDYYAKNMATLKQKDSSLKRPFPSSVFCGATYNGGPQTMCYPHKDFGNLAFGMCTVTPLGDFDPTLGGHLILWECHLVIEFPPGSTILLPSAVITHSNCTIQPYKK